MPFFLRLHSWIGCILTPVSVSVMLAWALIHIHPKLKQAIRILFIKYAYCRLVDICVSYKGINDRAMFIVTRCIAIWSELPLINRLNPIQPQNLYLRYLEYLQRQSENIIEACHRDKSNHINHLVNLCWALQVYFRETNTLFNDKQISNDKRISSYLNLMRLSYLELAVFMLSGQEKTKKRNGYICQIFSILQKEDKLGELLSDIHISQLLDAGQIGKLFTRLDNYSSQIQLQKTDHDMIKVYHYLLLVINLLRVSEKNSWNNRFIQLKNEIDRYLHTLSPIISIPEYQTEIMNTLCIENTIQSELIALRAHHDYELNTKIKNILSGEQSNGILHLILMADHNCLLYFLCAWVGFLTEQKHIDDPAMIRNLLAPAKDYRSGLHAQHMHLLMSRYSEKYADIPEFEETLASAKPLRTYLDIHSAYHAYYGRSNNFLNRP
ncbi:MAG: hypothetical protein GY795_41480 [Desulfobacterales bacterium]|nr:hypothetical protein [Desulfobacterales bacterium]